MPSRRSVLIGTGRTMLGAVAFTACSSGPTPSPEATDSGTTPSDPSSSGVRLSTTTLGQFDQPYGEWLRQSFTADQDLNASYGSLWWLNGKDSFVLPGPVARTQAGSLIPNAPADMVAALGKDDQKLYVSPDLSLVVARLGDRAVPEARPAISSFDDELWSMILRLRDGA